jgi:hypothetical protein
MSSSRTGEGAGTTTVWARALRSPWTVACAAAAVVLGPSAVTASALDRANAAPLHHAAAGDGREHAAY